MELTHPTTSPVRHLILIRHGESELNVANRTSRIFCGQFETPLTPRGREQGHEAGQRMAARSELQVRYAVSSVLQRAVETLELLVPHLPGPVQLLPAQAALNERSLGVFEGCSEEDVFRKWPQYRDDDRFNRFGSDFIQKAPGGENLTDVTTRAWRGLMDLWQATTGDLLAVSHSMTIRCILGQALSLTQEEVRQLRISNAVPVVLRQIGPQQFVRLDEPTSPA